MSTVNLYKFLSVVACKPQFPSYLSALLPQDQIFDNDQDFQFEPAPVKKKKESKNLPAEETKKSATKCSTKTAIIEDVVKAKVAAVEAVEENNESSPQQDTIDNPYLRPGKVPKLKNVTGGIMSTALTVGNKRDLMEIDI